ncbi:uncharacterized protein LODBEIA_P61290 [Lodderomyces beijingensis]|uniref:Mannosyltransferase n=1 Tax=Lodderomyces beijingensis TaxID=1775926 RepID=A0ABP0ZUT4_9ASCO
MMYKWNKVLDAALVALMTYHLVIAPYTKVEESFNIQAVHDILNFGILPIENLDNYDHKQFPGVVPRTFVGSLVLAALATPAVFISSLFGRDLLHGDQSRLQSLVRGILGLLNVFMLMRLRDAANKVTFRDKRSKIKGVVGFWFSVLLFSQFHLLYYSSRTLPNFIALPLVSYALSKLMVGDLTGLTYLAFTAVVFRMEVGVFAAIIAIVSSLGFGQSNIFANGIYLAAGALFGAFTSFAIDSYFWGRPVLPELESFLFNIISGESVNWGVEPWGAYFKKYLFQLFRPPTILILALPGVAGDPTEDYSGETSKPGTVQHPARNSLRILFVSSILYIAVMSFQPHKEWRFIVYTIPIFTLAAANGLANLSMKWSLSYSTKLLTVIITLMAGLGAILSLQMGYASSFNYPGGEALAFVNDYVKEDTHVKIHIDVPACMTGVTRFGELHGSNAIYDKTENGVDLSDFDLVITSEKLDNDTWKHLHSAKIYKRISIDVLLKLWRAQLADSSTILRLFQVIVEDFVAGTNQASKNLLRSTVVLEDHIHVYEKEKGKETEK